MDEILVRYTGDISDINKKIDILEAKNRSLEESANEITEAYKKLSAQYELLLKKLNGPGVKGVTSQFNALGNSINQLSREMPAFAVSANTGLLAISNNLPALSDAIAKIRAENKLLASEGKQTTSVLSQLGKALFSWQTLLSVGVTLLTVYGGKLIEMALSTKQLEEAQQRLTKSTELSNKAFEIEIRRLTALGVSEREIIALRKERTKQNIITADQELANQGKILRTTLDNFTKAKTAALQVGPERAIFLNLIAPSDKEISDAAFALRDVQLKREDLSVQLEELSKKDADIVKKDNEEKTKEAEKFENEQDKIQAIKDKRSEAERKRLRNDADFEKEILKERAETAEKLELSILKGLDERQRAAQKTEEKRLNESLKNKELSYDQTRALLDEQLEKGFITEQAYTNASIDLENQKTQAIITGMQSVANALIGFAALAGQNTEAGKSLAIASTIIETIASAQMAYKAVVSATYLGPAAPVLATVAAAGALAGGYARIQAMQAVTIPQSNLQQPNFQSAASTYKPAPNFNQGRRAFKDGVVNLEGPGTETSDSIQAYLSRGESVITAKATRHKRDELEALNTSVIDYEKLIMKKYVNPAIQKERERSFAENISASAQFNFSDKRIVKELQKHRPASANDIKHLTEEMAKANRTAEFENKLKGK